MTIIPLLAQRVLRDDFGRVLNVGVPIQNLDIVLSQTAADRFNRAARSIESWC
jgi:hypothetical protein